MVLKSTKKPRRLAGALPVFIVFLFGGIIFMYGSSFSDRVLDLASFSSQSSDYTEGSLESRVKGYEITEQTAFEKDEEADETIVIDDPVVDEPKEIPESVEPKKEEDKEEDPTEEAKEDKVEETKEEEDKEDEAEKSTEEEDKEEKPTDEEKEDKVKETKEEEVKVDEAEKSTEEEGKEEDKEEGDDEEYAGEDIGDEGDYEDNDDEYNDASDGKQHLVDAEYDEEEEEEGEEKGQAPSKASVDYEYEEEMASPSPPKDLDEAQDENLDDSTDSAEKFLKVLEKCRDLICIQEAHQKYPRSSKMFNFPHFMIIGFQKAATTSLKQYLQNHSYISKPRVKEPNFFPYDCHEKPPEKCSRANTTAYITKTLHLQDYIDAKGEIAMFEASTHIVRAGHNLAPRMAKLMPWLKIIVQFREPISRAASMLIHNKDVNGVGCLMKAPMGHCLLHHSQITEMPTKRYYPITYTEAIKPWIEAFPKEQIHIIQYEALTDEKIETSELLRVRKFLGVSLDEPKGGLGLANARRFTINPEGWQLQRSQYEELVDIVKPDMDSLVELLYDHDLIDDTESWKKVWQAHWDENMKTCENEKNICKISLS